MTEEQKDILIARMLDSPASLTDEQLEMIFHDEELRDIYEMSVEVSSACVRQPQLDMEKELELFRPRIRRKPFPMQWVMRVAAIFLGVLLISSVAGWIIDYIFSSSYETAIAKVEKTSEVKDLNPVKEIPSVAEPRDETSAASIEHGRIKKNAAVGSPVRHSKKQEAPETQEADEIDLDEYLRIQQARIDNEIAMQNAEIYRVEYSSYLRMINPQDIYEEDMESEIGYLTMQ